MTKLELKEKLASDLLRFDGGGPQKKDWILHNECHYVWRYIKHMRKVEYHCSNNGWHKLAYLYHLYVIKRLQFKLHLYIYPNTIGKGFRIYHIGNYTHVGSNVRIGENCTMVSGVVFGNKEENSNAYSVSVGDNCYFGLDCRIFGSVKIGNNVTIGANSIITKDVPDNAIVVGVNKILGYKNI